MKELNCPPLLAIPPERLAEVIEALRARGVPIEVNVIPGEESRVEAEIELTEEDEGWLADFLAEPGDTAGGAGH